MTERLSIHVSLAILTGCLSSCGAGTAGIAAGAGGGGSGARPSIANLRLEDAKRSPARIRFDLQNAAATIELEYRNPDTGAFEPIRQVPANPLSAAPGPIEVDWDFVAESGIDPDGAFEGDVAIRVGVAGRPDDAAELDQGVGNDLPRITLAEASIDPAAGEGSGIVLIEAVLEDTPGDLARVRVEYSLDGSTWQLARPAQDDSTPEYAFPQSVAVAGGTSLAFFWDTLEDLGDADTDALVRLVPFEDVDGTLEQGLVGSTATFHVDNNDEPVVFLGDGALLATDDSRRGVVIPFTVSDEEGDQVDVLFQWRRAGEAFPDLSGRSADELRALLQDPVQREAAQIANEFPSPVVGRVVPVDATTVDLPDLSSDHGFLLANSLVGRDLEILRPKAATVEMPVPGVDPLTEPVAVLSIGDGLLALVLDRTGDGEWRLVTVEVATGAILGQLATGAEEPDALAWEPGRESALLACHNGDVWSIQRVTLSGERELLAVADGSTELGPIRGLLALGSDVALITVGSSLVLVEHSGLPLPRFATLLGDLHTPWGLALDPHRSRHVFLAEQSAPVSVGQGRVVSIDLDRPGLSPEVVRPLASGNHPFPSPRALLLDEGGRRLLVSCDSTAPGRFGLRALSLGQSGNRTFFSLDEARETPIQAIAAGKDGLVLWSLVGSRALWLRGGLEQRRTITETVRSERLVVDQPFQPPLETSRQARLWNTLGSVSAAPGGTKRLFTWDSSDAGSGEVFLRAIPLDCEVGPMDESTGGKRIRSPHDGPTLQLDPLGGHAALATADIDGDGDVDIVSANDGTNDLRIYYQEAQGEFSTAPIVLGGGTLTGAPVAVLAEDIDGDGMVDILSANSGSDSLTLFFQGPRGVFSNLVEVSLRGPTGSSGTPTAVVAGDLDSDGDIDLLAAVRNENSEGGMRLFYQTGSRSFVRVTGSILGFDVGERAAPLVTADIDADGRSDIVMGIVDQASGRWRVSALLQGLQGLTIAPWDIQTPQPDSLAVGDFDGDGRVDIAAAHLSQSTIDLWLQEPDGRFSPPPASR